MGLDVLPVIHYFPCQMLIYVIFFRVSSKLIPSYCKVSLQVECLQLTARWETNFRPYLPRIKG